MMRDIIYRSEKRTRRSECLYPGDCDLSTWAGKALIKIIPARTKLFRADTIFSNSYVVYSEIVTREFLDSVPE